MKIRLSISYLLVFIFLCLPVVSWAASVTLRWQANSEPDIAGYNLYYGTASRSYGPPMPTGNTTSYTVDNLVEGQTYYFALTALDTSGNESGYSSEITANATSSEPATEDYTLLLSYNSDRSDAVDLSGQTISGDVYIYLNPEAYVSQVVFSIDGQTHNTENYAPYDVGEPFDTTSLSNGSHNISASVRLQDGTTDTLNTIFNAQNPLTSSTEIYTLPSNLSLGKIPDGDDTHADKVVYSFAGISGNVQINYEGFDIDNGVEVRVFVNGSPVDYMAETANNSWGNTKTIILPDNLVNDSSQNILTFDSTYNEGSVTKYWWGVRNVSTGSTIIALPSTSPLGKIPDGDETHADKVAYSFAGVSGDVHVSYEGFDIDNEVEVRVFVNGRPVDYMTETANNSWGNMKMITLPDNLVNDWSQNILTFDSTYNEGSVTKYWWGVRNVSIGSTIIALPSALPLGKIPDGDETHADKVVYSFEGISGDVQVNCEGFDIDNEVEVRVFVNGNPVDYMAETANNSWGNMKMIILPDNLVNDSSQNVLTFDSTYNEGSVTKYWWGVRNVTVQ